MEVGKQATLNDLKDLSKEMLAISTDVDAIKKSGTIGGINDAGSRNYGIAAYSTEVSGAGYIHFKTTMRPDTHSRFFRIHVSGFAYLIPEILDTVFAGFCYSGGNEVTQIIAKGTGLPDSLPSIYVTSDGFVAFRMYLSDRYFTSLVVDSMALRGAAALTSAELEITTSTEASL